jgi:hypothetical protein
VTWACNEPPREITGKEEWDKECDRVTAHCTSSTVQSATLLVAACTYHPGTRNGS